MSGTPEDKDKDFTKGMVETWRTKDLIDYVLEDLDLRVKKDRPVKLSVLATGISALGPEPINLFLKGESGVGKTYNVIETLKYFPQDMIWYLGGMSQKSLIHSYGVLLNKNGEEIDLENRPVKPSKKSFEDDDEYKEALQQYQEQTKTFREELRESYTIVDLSHRIIVFLEAPDYHTYQMLRPILSHDKEEIQYQFVDKTGKGQLRTMKVVLKGWPATIFLTLDSRYMEELATRSFTATPESSELKILAVNVLTNFKVSLPWKYEKETEAFKVIKRLIQSLHNNALESKLDVAVPFLNLYELFPRQISRDMRDFQHFTQFLKTITLLHFFQRAYMKVADKRIILCTLGDVKTALSIYKEVFETTRTGTERRILDFYHSIVKTREQWYLTSVTDAYNEKARKKLSEERVRVMLERLDEIGYVNIQKDTLDKRKNLYLPLITKEEKDTFILENDLCLDLKAKLEKGFESWKTNILVSFPFFIYRNNPEEEGRWSEAELSPTELHRLIIEGERIFLSSSEQSKTRIISNEASEPTTEIKPETSLKPDSRINVDNSLGQEVKK